MTDENDVVFRLRKRAEIRRQITTRKSVQEGKPDRLADLLDEAADEIEQERNAIVELVECARLRGDNDLPHPCDDPKLWTARMQDAWSEVERIADEL